MPPTITSYSWSGSLPGYILVAVGEPETIPTGSASLCREHLSVYTANQDLRGLEIRTSKYKCAAAELDTQAIVSSYLEGDISSKQRQPSCFLRIVLPNQMTIESLRRSGRSCSNILFFRCRDSRGDCVRDACLHSSRWRQHRCLPSREVPQFIH